MSLKTNKVFTDTRVEVTERIKSGLTQYVASRREAEIRTKLRGYFYELFDADKNPIGYGIPQ